MGRLFDGYGFALAQAAATATLLLTCTSAIAADEHGEARSPEPQPDSNRELTFEEFAKDYRCPEWFRDAKFGLWAHWGPQTVPRLGGGWYARHMYMPEVPKGEEFGSRAYGFHVKTYGHPSEFGFKDVINLWKAEKFDADALTALFKKCGAKYVVALANHHDHFDCFASTHHPWITDTTLGSDWFYKEDRPLVHNARTVIEILADAVSKNGGLLMNVELYPDGSVPAPQLAILEDIGAWLRTHGEAIYETRPWKIFGQVSRDGKHTPGAGHFNERTVDSPPYAPEEVRFTTRGRSLYAILLNPRPGRLLIRPLGLDADTRPGRVSRVDMLGHRAGIPFEQSADGLAVTLPNKLPTSYAAALKIEGALPERQER